MARINSLTGESGVLYGSGFAKAALGRNNLREPEWLALDVLLPFPAPNYKLLEFD
jgi:hypothetical protein